MSSTKMGKTEEAAISERAETPNLVATERDGSERGCLACPARASARSSADVRPTVNASGETHHVLPQLVPDRVLGVVERNGFDGGGPDGVQ